MKIRSVFLRVGIMTIAGVILGVQSLAVAVTVTNTYEMATSPDVFLTELQTASSTSASEEFIEIYNNSDTDIDFSDTANGGKTQWKLQYFSKTNLAAMLTANDDPSGWNILPGSKTNSATKTIVISGVVPSHGYFVLASTGYLPGNIEPDQTYASGLAADGGAVQLISVTALTSTTTKNIVHDRLAWAAAGVLTPASDLAYLPPVTGETLQRTLNDEDRYVGSDNMLEAWKSAAMTPKDAWQRPEPTYTGGDTTTDTGGTGTTGDTTGGGNDGSGTPSDTTDTTGTGSDGTIPNVVNDGLDMPIINELLPNPSSDESDEYIELYNPNDEAFNLKGYELQTGIDSIHSFVITSDTLLPPEAYTVLKYTDTKLSLTNSGGRARLLNTNKQIVSETAQYGTAHEAWAWARNDQGDWAWTDAPTPGLNNTFPIVSLNESPLLATAKKTTGKVKGVSTKKASTKKAAAKKTAKKAKAKKAKKTKKTPVQTASLPSAAQQNVRIHPAALAAVATGALGYVAYEYRKDIANKLAKLRRH